MSIEYSSLEILNRRQYSHLIWLGDLNYRINFSEPEIKSCLRKGQLDTLIVADQVRKILNVLRHYGYAYVLIWICI